MQVSSRSVDSSLPAMIMNMQRHGLTLGKVAKNMVAFTIIDSYLDAHARTLERITHCTTPGAVGAAKNVYSMTPDGNLKKIIMEALALSTMSVMA